MNKKEYTILKKRFGCDFVVQLPKGRRGRPISVLQITDPQIIDSSQMRRPDRLSESAAKAWAPENFDRQCGNHIRSLIEQTKPDLIFITGDIVYGEFDDNGTALKWLCELMDSFAVPWAPVFGNHDNESRMGVDYQCGLFESAKYCLFERGNVTGNGNYTVGVAIGNDLVRVIHLLDSNGCTHSEDEAVMKNKGIYEDQFELVRKNTNEIRRSTSKFVPAFLAFHIPHHLFYVAERKKGYIAPDRFYYTIGVDVPAKDGDFGFKHDSCDAFETKTDMAKFCQENSIEAIFIGHHHNTATVINYEGLKLVFGLKTGQYDSYIPGNIGGTLITLLNEEYSVTNVSSCCPYGPVPHGEMRYEGFFQE